MKRREKVESLQSSVHMSSLFIYYIYHLIRHKQQRLDYKNLFLPTGKSEIAAI